MGLDDQDGISNRANQPIESLLNEIEAIWNRGDLLAYAGLYANNAGYVSRAGKLLTGRTEIEELHATAFVGPLRNTKLTLKTRRIEFLTSTVALVYADVELERGGNDNNSTRAITTFVVANANEGWGIFAAHTTELAAQKT
jgi:uncharacterized protein (TIGR02246 family)